MIIVLNSNGNVNVTDFYSTGYEKPTKTTGTTFNVVSTSVNNQGIFATFSRALKPSSSKDTVLSPEYVTDFSYAYLSTPNQGLQIHNTNGTGLIIFGAYSSTAKFTRGASNTPYISLNSDFKLGWEFSPKSILFTFNVLSI